MNITSSQFKRCDVLHVDGRVDSATAPQLNAAFELINSIRKIPYCPGSFLCDIYVQRRFACIDQCPESVQTL